MFYVRKNGSHFTRYGQRNYAPDATTVDQFRIHNFQILIHFTRLIY